MKRFIYNSFLLMLLSLGSVGCGKEAGAGVHPEFTHERNLRQNDFDASAITWEFDNQQGLKIHKTDTDLYLQFTHHSDLPNVQFFLDIDNDEKTGVAIELGSDYMVENGWLYEATTENAWGWKEIAQVSSTISAGEKDTVMVPLSMLKNKNTTFKAYAESLDSTWNPKIFSPPADEAKFIYQ